MIDKIFDKTNQLLGNITAVLMILVMINVFLDVVLRYFFHNGSIAMQEMEWHLFSVMFLLGISYALTDEGHVRVDFMYDKLSKKTKAKINIFGTIFFLIPFALFISYGSYPFVMDSYVVNEISEDPGGLSHRWIIKSMIPIAFIVLLFTSVGYIRKNINIIKNN